MRLFTSPPEKAGSELPSYTADGELTLIKVHGTERAHGRSSSAPGPCGVSDRGLGLPCLPPVTEPRTCESYSASSHRAVRQRAPSRGHVVHKRKTEKFWFNCMSWFSASNDVVLNACPRAAYWPVDFKYSG